jgi:Holliday junction resolvase RusA-like endonuclease
MRNIFYHLFVNGEPKAQPRPRMALNGHVYNPHTADSWKEEVKACFIPCLKTTLTTPVHLRVNFFLPRPKSLKDREISNTPFVKKPDLDNLLKSTMDALTEIKVWQDDALVYAIEACKWFAKKSGKIGAQIIVESEL